MDKRSDIGGGNSLEGRCFSDFNSAKMFAFLPGFGIFRSTD